MNTINKNFIEQLLIKANPDIDDDALDMLSQDVEPVLFDRIMTNIATKLSDQQLGEFSTLAKSKASDKEIYAYLAKCIPDYEDFIEKIYIDFENMYIENYSSFKKDLQ
ncbi:TPA: hypothetical protein DEP21_01340 [Patescibacteria group bacterium]|nr:hypothetical protein [Candidatus Gracilibacteria bacterium]